VSSLLFNNRLQPLLTLGTNISILCILLTVSHTILTSLQSATWLTAPLNTLLAPPHFLQCSTHTNFIKLPHVLINISRQQAPIVFQSIWVKNVWITHIIIIALNITANYTSPQHWPICHESSLSIAGRKSCHTKRSNSSLFNINRRCLHWHFADERHQLFSFADNGGKALALLTTSFLCWYEM
jgi:hypothetical protein